MTTPSLKFALGCALLVGSAIMTRVPVETQTGTSMTSQKSTYHNEHVELSDLVESVGIDVIVNHPVCDKERAYGWYSYQHKSIVICQEGKVKGSTEQVEWTEEDYDTLRHEVHHVVQDCRGGIDGVLSGIYKEPFNLGKNVLGVDGIRKVVRSYPEVSAHMLTMEIEAFSVAQMNDVEEQMNDVRTYCM